MQKQLARGESYTVPADAFEPRLWTGRPDALTVTIGGQAVPALSDHRGIVRDVPVTAQALLARATPAAAPLATSTPVVAPTPRVPHRRPQHRDTGDTSQPPAAATAPSPVPAAAGAAPAPSATGGQ
jgi:hypothetical protein